jgi:hypothetical protein
MSENLESQTFIIVAKKRGCPKIESGRKLEVITVWSVLQKHPFNAPGNFYYNYLPVFN